MWMKIISPAIIVTFLTGIAAVASAQDATTEGKSTTAPGIYPTDRPGPGNPSPGTGDYSALGAGDAAVGNWTGKNSGVNRSQTRGYSAVTPSYSGGTVAPVAPGGNGAVGAGDTDYGSWTGTNPGIDRRPSASYYYGGLR